MYVKCWEERGEDARPTSSLIGINKNRALLGAHAILHHAIRVRANAGAV